MKHIKLLKVPADTIVHEMLDREPHYVSVDGVCLNLNELAVSLINSLSAKVDELKNVNEEAVKAMETIAPDVYKLVDLYDGTALVQAEDYAEIEEEFCEEPEAKIIATFLTVQESK